MCQTIGGKLYMKFKIKITNNNIENNHLYFYKWLNNSDWLSTPSQKSAKILNKLEADITYSYLIKELSPYWQVILQHV